MNKELHKGNILRATWWDYDQGGYYFITFKTLHRAPFLGRIESGQMMLSDEGKQAVQLWKEIPSKFPFVELDEFVIMPDHVHAILLIKENRSTINREPTGDAFESRNPMRHNGLSKVVRWYKGRATFELRKLNERFEWQSRYHDKIIRNENHLEITRQYIR